MFSKLNNLGGGFGHALPQSPDDLLFVLLGKTINGLSYEQMVLIWETAGRHIANMYHAKLSKG